MPAHSPRKKPSQRRSEITVEAILGAAARIFEDGSYRTATTAKVAEKAGVSVGSLYQYYPNKLALLAGVKHRYLVALFRRLEDALGQAAGVRAGLRQVIRINLEETWRARRLWRLFVEELPARLDARLHRPSEAPHVAMLQGFFRRHRAELGDRDPALAALVVAEFVDAVTRAAVQDRPEDLCNGVIEEELLDGVCLYLHGRPALRRASDAPDRIVESAPRGVERRATSHCAPCV